jgi:tRNA U38,U39,U40 pseudouridine synthase TruA
VIFSQEERTIKKQVAIFLGGLQKNENRCTIHAELEPGTPFIDCRTDKGVHACAPVVSLKIELTAATATNETMHNRINDCLPPNIQSSEMYRFVVVDRSFSKVLTGVETMQAVRAFSHGSRCSARCGIHAKF